MNKLFLLFFICCSLIITAQKKIKLELTFKYYKPYCDNAKATIEQQEEAKKEKPLAQQKFYVYQNNKCIDSLVTDDNGNIIIKYYPGTYYLLEPWKHLKGTPDNSPLKDFYKDCLKKEWDKPNYKLTISNADFKLTYYEISVSRCPEQLACLKVRHLPSQIKRQ